MESSWQIWAVAIAVLGALVYVLVKWLRNGGGKGTGCGKCGS